MYIEEIHNDDLRKLNVNSVFSSCDWISIYDPNELVLLGVFNKNKEIIGSFYFMKHRRAKILTHVSPPFLSPHCGLFFEDNTINPAQKNTFRKKIFTVIQEYLNQLKYDVLTLPFPSENVDMQSFIWNGFSTSPKYTYQIDLDQSEDDILAKMSPNRRKNIKKAQKEGVLCEFSLNSENSQKLIENTFVKKNLTYNKQVLNSIFNQFSKTDNSISFTSFQSKKPIATVFCVFDKNVAYYILGGFDETDMHEGAGALAMWEAIKYAKSKGIKIFDFEGSMHPPIEKYFRGFGGELVPFYVIQKTNFIGRALLKIRTK